MTDDNLDGRVAIVTGGGGGMGGAMALGLAEAGARVAAVDTNPEALDALTATAEKSGLEAATSSWAKDLAGTGVTVNVLVPGGPTNTGFIPANAPFERHALIQPDVMVAPIRWLVSNASDGVTDCRFVGIDWDGSLASDEAAENARAPAAWPDIGSTAAWPGAR